MALLNFQQRFISRIECGEKTQTIRAIRKVPITPGETLHLYTGLRHKGARLLMRVPCTRVQSVNLSLGDERGLEVSVDGVALARDEREVFARNDGFPQFSNMLEFWDGLYPFAGQIIHWDFNQRRLM